MNTKDNIQSVRRLIYILTSILLLLTMISSCGGSKNMTVKTINSEPEKQQASEPSTQAKTSENLLLASEITAAVKQLKNILDLRLESQVPMRMEGIVISNQGKTVPLRDIAPDSLLYKIVQQRGIAQNDEDADRLLVQLTKQRGINISQNLKARLTNTGSDPKTIESFEAVMQNPKEFSKAYFPICIELSTNFYDKKAVKSSPACFFASLKVNEQQHYDGFNLFDLQYKSKGTLSMPLAPTPDSLDQKMIIEFSEEFKLNNGNLKIEQRHTVVLQLAKVNTVKNDFAPNQKK